MQKVSREEKGMYSVILEKVESCYARTNIITKSKISAGKKKHAAAFLHRIFAYCSELFVPIAFP